MLNVDVALNYSGDATCMGLDSLRLVTLDVAYRTWAMGSIGPNMSAQMTPHAHGASVGCPHRILRCFMSCWHKCSPPFFGLVMARRGISNYEPSGGPQQFNIFWQDACDL